MDSGDRLAGEPAAVTAGARGVQACSHSAQALGGDDVALRRLLKLACPAACAACLAAGYAAAGKWLMLAPVALVWLGWMFTASWPPSVLLAACAGLAAGGLWAGASPFLMLPAAAL